MFSVHLDADIFVVGLRRVECILQITNVVIKVVQGYVDTRLILVAVAEIAHPERRPERRIPGVAAEFLHAYVGAAAERFAHRRRRTKQIQSQPAKAAEISNQAEVLVGAKCLLVARVIDGCLVPGPE